jgi:hypothetical protein
MNTNKRGLLRKNTAEEGCGIKAEGQATEDRRQKTDDRKLNNEYRM